MTLVSVNGTVALDHRVTRSELTAFHRFFWLAYHLAGAEQSQILTIYDVVPGPPPVRHAPKKAAASVHPPRWGRFF